MYETMNVKARPTDAFSSIRRVILEDLPKGSSTRRRCSCVADDYDKICNCSIGHSSLSSQDSYIGSVEVLDSPKRQQCDGNNRHRPQDVPGNMMGTRRNNKFQRFVATKKQNLRAKTFSHSSEDANTTMETLDTTFDSVESERQNDNTDSPHESSQQSWDMNSCYRTPIAVVESLSVRESTKNAKQSNEKTEPHRTTDNTQLQMQCQQAPDLNSSSHDTKPEAKSNSESPTSILEFQPEFINGLPPSLPSPTPKNKAFNFIRVETNVSKVKGVMKHNTNHQQQHRLSNQTNTTNPIPKQFSWWDDDANKDKPCTLRTDASSCGYWDDDSTWNHVANESSCQDDCINNMLDDCLARHKLKSCFDGQHKFLTPNKEQENDIALPNDCGNDKTITSGDSTHDDSTWTWDHVGNYSCKDDCVGVFEGCFDGSQKDYKSKRDDHENDIALTHQDKATTSDSSSSSYSEEESSFYRYVSFDKQKAKAFGSVLSYCKGKLDEAVVKGKQLCAADSLDKSSFTSLKSMADNEKLSEIFKVDLFDVAPSSSSFWEEDNGSGEYSIATPIRCNTSGCM